MPPQAAVMQWYCDWTLAIGLRFRSTSSLPPMAHLCLQQRQAVTLGYGPADLSTVTDLGPESRSKTWLIVNSKHLLLAAWNWRHWSLPGSSQPQWAEVNMCAGLTHRYMLFFPGLHSLSTWATYPLFTLNVTRTDVPGAGAFYLQIDRFTSTSVYATLYQ